MITRKRWKKYDIYIDIDIFCIALDRINLCWTMNKLRHWCIFLNQSDIPNSSIIVNYFIIVQKHGSPFHVLIILFILYQIFLLCLCLIIFNCTHLLWLITSLNLIAFESIPQEDSHYFYLLFYLLIFYCQFLTYQL